MENVAEFMIFGEVSINKKLLEFLTQQKWASAYEKNQSGQNTVVIQNTQSAPALTLPPGPVPTGESHGATAHP